MAVAATTRPIHRNRQGGVLRRAGVAVAATALIVPSTAVLRAPAASAAYAAGPGLGQQRFYPMAGSHLTDRMGFKVNLFNGNLVVSNRDLAMRGTKLGIAVDRTYNSQASVAKDVFGYGWAIGMGNDVSLDAQADGSQNFNGPGGFVISFAPNGAGGFISPTGIDATLVQNADSSFTLKSHKSEGTLNFNSAGYLTSIADRDNNRNVMHRNAYGLLTSVTDSQQRTTRFTLNASWQVASVTDPAGQTYSYTYDAAGNLTKYVDPTQAATAYAYDGSHRLTQITTPAGRVITFAYDTSNRVISTTRGGATTSYTYGAGTTTVTDANGHSTQLSFDSVGRAYQIVDALGRGARRTFTADSNVSTFQDPAGGSGSISYDANDNATSATVNTGQTAQAQYGNPAHPWAPTSGTDSAGNTATASYDAAGHVVAARNGLPTNNQATATYNANGTVASVTDAMNATTTFGYDAAGNRTSDTPPAPLGSGHAVFDSLSRMTSSTDGKGQQTTYAYDGDGRLKTATFADGTAVSNTYDGDGNLLSQTSPGSVETYTFNALNEVTQKTINGVTASATYDGVGNMTSSTDAGGTVTYGYNPVNQVTQSTEPNGQVTTFTYDAVGRRTGTTYPNGVSMTTAYDATGHKTSATTRSGSGAVISSSTFSYTDPVTGRTTNLRYSMTDEGGNVTRFTYDQANRLTRALRTNAGGTTLSDNQYTYDGNGNRLSTTVNGVTTTSSYNAANQLVSSNGVTYSYDADGNLVSDSTGFAQTFNAANQVTSVRRAAGQPTVAMAYAGGGQKQRLTAGSTSFLHGIHGITGVTDTSGTTYYTRDSGGHLLESRGPGGNYYYAFDGAGSVVALTDSAGNVVNRYQYDPYGSAATGTVEAVSNPWKFEGGYQDTTGLYKFGARYEKTDAGRWTQRDQVESGNRYTYAGDQPVTMRDPSGHYICLDGTTDTCGVGADSDDEQPVGDQSNADSSADPSADSSGDSSVGQPDGGDPSDGNCGSDCFDPSVGGINNPTLDIPCDCEPADGDFTVNGTDPSVDLATDGGGDGGGDGSIGNDLIAAGEGFAGGFAVATAVPQILVCPFDFGATCATGIAEGVGGLALIGDAFYRLGG